jgi:hypothetical protein
VYTSHPSNWNAAQFLQGCYPLAGSAAILCTGRFDAYGGSSKNLKELKDLPAYLAKKAVPPPMTLLRRIPVL